MQKYTIETIQVDEDGYAQGHSQADAFYPAAFVDAEIALLKAEIEGLVNDHNLKDCDIERMRAEAELLKAALRDVHAFLVRRDPGPACECCEELRAQIAKIAPLIAEAVGEKKDG